MEYEIVRLDANGNGYVVITREDGTSFGQNVTGCKLQTQQEWDDYAAAILEQVDGTDAVARVVVPTAILNTVGTRKSVVRPAR